MLNGREGEKENKGPCCVGCGAGLKSGSKTMGGKANRAKKGAGKKGEASGSGGKRKRGGKARRDEEEDEDGGEDGDDETSSDEEGLGLGKGKDGDKARACGLDVSRMQLCDHCRKLFRSGQFCPLCFKVWLPNERGNWVCCDTCSMWVHAECEGFSQTVLQVSEVMNILRVYGLGLRVCVNG